jgi:hypothetical protein
LTRSVGVVRPERLWPLFDPGNDAFVHLSIRYSSGDIHRRLRRSWRRFEMAATNVTVVSISGVLRRSASLFASGIDLGLELPDVRRAPEEFPFPKVISVELTIETGEKDSGV